MKIIFSLLRDVVQNWNCHLSAEDSTSKLTNLGFPNNEFQARFQGKRQGFDGKKPNWNALWRNMSRDITGHKQSRLPSKTLWKLLLYLHFHSYFKTTSPNCFNVFCKILLQSIFLARIINKNKNKSKNSKISGTNSEATSGHSGASLKHSWASRILYFTLRRTNMPESHDLACPILSRSRCITL